MTASIASEIDRYLRTGDTDEHYSAWPSDSFSHPPTSTRTSPSRTTSSTRTPTSSTTASAAPSGCPSRGGRSGCSTSFRQRETFAWSCEAYARIVERARRFADREVLAGEFAEHFTTCGDDRVDPGEVVDIVSEASTRRNGWKAILARCKPERRPRYAEPTHRP